MPTRSAASPPEGAARPWCLLLLPVFFLVHIGEELWAGEGFAAWTSRLSGSPVTEVRYAAINGIGWPIFASLTVVAVLRPRSLWLAATLSTLLLVNACLHALGTLVTASYSPGLVSALVLYPPTCVAALRLARRSCSSATFFRAVLAGAGLHALVLLAAFVR
jgi:hypothetical protein